jgi:hypothetical protein
VRRELAQHARVAGLQLASLRAKRAAIDKSIAALEEFREHTLGHLAQLSAESIRANSAPLCRNRRYRRDGALFVMEASA